MDNEYWCRPRMCYATYNIQMFIRATSTLAIVSLIALTGWFGAQWFWRFYTLLIPPPAKALDAPIRTTQTLNLEPMKAWLGTAGSLATASALPMSNLLLKGILFERGSHTNTASTGIFNLGTGRDIAVRVGEDIRPGSTLTAIYKDRAEVSENGATTVVMLEYKTGKPGSSMAGNMPTGVPATANPGTSSRGGFALAVNQVAPQQFQFSRRELEATLKDAQALNFLGRLSPAPSGGARVDDAAPGTLAQRLGLQAGDIVRSINGQLIGSPGEMARLYQDFAKMNQVEAEVLRGGTPQRITFTIKP